MSTYTRRRHSPKGKHSKGHVNFYTHSQHGVPGRIADRVDQPFPNKPVSHRRPPKPQAQASLDLYDFEKITITNQSRGRLSHQNHPSNGIKQTTASERPTKDSHRLPRGELQMAKAIHAKELMLQEKLWRVEEKIRQKIQRDGVGAAAGETKTRQSEQQRRQPVRGNEIQDRRQEDVKHPKKQDQRNEDRLRNTHEGEKFQKKGREGTHEITDHGQEVSGELKKLRWQTVKKHTRSKGAEEQYSGMWRETGVTSEDGANKAKERQQNPTAGWDKGWTKEENCRERTCKEMCASEDEQDMPQKSQERTAASENHRGPARTFRSSVSGPSHPSGPEQGGFTLTDSTDTSLQLLPCKICYRKFASERLAIHAQICKKVKQSHRQVFNSYVNRTKGSAIEEFWKSHSRTKSPEVLKKTLKQSYKVNTRNLHERQLPAGTSRPVKSK